jgi:hypothetical protein
MGMGRSMPDAPAPLEVSGQLFVTTRCQDFPSATTGCSCVPTPSEVVAGFGEAEREGSPDADGAAGDEGDLSGGVSGHGACA